MTLADNLIVVDVERCKPTAFPFDDEPSGPTYPLRARKDVKLPPLRGKHRPGHHPGMKPLYAFGVEVERKRIDINPWIIIVLSAVVFAFGLALLATWAHGVTQPEPSPYVVSVMEHGSAVFLAELLGMHGGSAR